MTIEQLNPPDQGAHLKKKTSRFSRIVAVLAVVSFLGGFTATAAYATTVSSAYRVLGNTSTHTFYSWSYASDTSGGYGRGTTTASGSGIVGTGHLGALGRLYHSNGVVCRATSMIVSNTSTNSWSVTTSGGPCGIDNYYGMGSAKYWHYTGYSATTLNHPTPWIALP